MSSVRILALVALALMLVALTSRTIRNSHAFALVTGQCLHRPAPAACRPAPPPIPAGKDI